MATILWDRVKILQEAHGWSDRELARRLRFSASHLCDVKSGRRPATIEFIDALCEVLQLPYERLIRHPSLKPAYPRQGHRWYDHAPRRAPSRLCRDPEHRSLESPKEQGRIEKAVSNGLPQQVRRRFWGTRWGRELKA